MHTALVRNVRQIFMHKDELALWREGHEVGFQSGNSAAGLVSRWKCSAWAAQRFGQQTFVIALQPQKSVGVACDDIHQAAPLVGGQGIEAIVPQAAFNLTLAFRSNY